MYTLISFLEAAGTIMIAFAALRVHHRVLHEHKIDKNVERSMMLEQILGILGVFFIIAAFFLKVTTQS